jgi:hypothetical protein
MLILFAMTEEQRLVLACMFGITSWAIQTPYKNIDNLYLGPE